MTIIISMGNCCCCEAKGETNDRIAYQYPFHSKEQKQLAHSHAPDNPSPRESYHAFGQTSGDLIDERDLI